MRSAPTEHHLRVWLRTPGTEGPSSHVSTAETRRIAAHHEAEEIRRGVTWQEKLLLAAILLTVVGWIVFRLVMQLVTIN